MWFNTVVGENKKNAVSALGQLVMTLGLLFIGWGLRDLRSFFAHPARIGLVAVVVMSFAAVMAFSLPVQPFRKGKQPIGRQRRRIIMGTLSVLFLLWFLPFCERQGLAVFRDFDALRYVGLVLSAGGQALRLVALGELGKQYSAYITLQDNHQLVQTGIYRFIRHPLYLGLLLLFVGIPLLFRSWLAIPLFALSIVFAARGIRQEEKLLSEHFATEFELYRRRTWRLLPYLY